MDTLALLGTALGLGLASGLSLYGTVFVTGLAVHLGWIRLAPEWHGLAVLASPVVLAPAGVLFGVELLADKIPWLDSPWDGVCAADPRAPEPAGRSPAGPRGPRTADDRTLRPGARRRLRGHRVGDGGGWRPGRPVGAGRPAGVSRVP